MFQVIVIGFVYTSEDCYRFCLCDCYRICIHFRGLL